MATGDNNQLIGILEEDSEDFEEEDEDDEDEVDEDIDPQKAEYFQADTDVFNDDEEGKRELEALDEVMEEDMGSDDGIGNGADSAGEDIDRD